MEIAAIQKNSFVDYPGHISAVIFTQGCNMNCYFCHNSQLIPNRKGTCSKREVLDFLKNRQGVLEAVVITGGETTIQEGLTEFIKDIRGLGYKIKLDTNGSSPLVLKGLIEQHLIDYVAMDIKANLKDYPSICSVRNATLDALDLTIDLIIKSGINNEFRTTVTSSLEEKDIIWIANRIKGAQKYVLQQFRNPERTGKILDYRALKPPYEPKYIKELAERVNDIIHCETRGV